jgi:hypothetical protein
MHMPMQPSDLLLAIALLSAPVGTPEQVPDSSRWPVMSAAIRWVAIDWEIMDEREVFGMMSSGSFQYDIDFLRKRRIDLADAPKLNDSCWLPERQFANNNCHFNAVYRKHLEKRLIWEPDRFETISAVIAEADHLYQIWDAIRDAKGELNYVAGRRFALAKLKRLMSEEDWQACVLPPYVPDWRFQQAR